MTEPVSRVAVFFYGTFMDVTVLRAHGCAASAVTPASVAGFRLVIRPRVNLEPAPAERAFGSIAEVSHAELAQLYGGLQHNFGLTYRPLQVRATTSSGETRSVECYITEEMEPRAADPVYVAELAGCVRALGHPEWYAQHVESFAADR